MEAKLGLKYPKSIANGNSSPCLSISYDIVTHFQALGVKELGDNK